MGAENEKSTKLLDETGQRILQTLQKEARLSFSEIGSRVGLSTSAVIERVQRMEEAGIINGYHAAVDAQKLGYSMLVFIRLHTAPERYPRVQAIVESMPEVLECYHVTGEESFVMKVVVESVSQLEGIIQRLSPFGKTATSVVLSTTIRREVLKCCV